MARINNKFATQNLNDIYGKREPKPQAAADSANAAGGRARAGAAHGSGGGMLVLRPPVKQPPVPLKDPKTTSTSIPALKKDAPPTLPPPQLPQNPLVSSTNPHISFNNNDRNNKAELGAGSDSPPPPITTISITREVAAREISKAEPSDAISLRPNQNRRPEIYTPPAARSFAQNAPDKTTEILPPLQTPTPSSSNSVLNESVLEKALETEKDEPSVPIPTPADVVKPSKPEPFRPPQLRGDAARRLEPSTVPMIPREDLNLNSNSARGWDRDRDRDSHRNSFQQRSRRDEEGRYSRDAQQQQQHRRYDHDQRGGGGGYYNREGNSYSSYYSRSAPEARNYDIEVIRPGSGESDQYNSGNNRDFAYGGRQGFDRQIMSPPSYPYWGEGQGQGQGHANYDSYEHRQGFNRRGYNNNNFKSGGINHRDFQNRYSSYVIGRDGGGQQRREQPYGRSGQGQFRDNFTAQAHANGRFSVLPREQQDGGNFRQHLRTHRDTYGGSGYRYNDPSRFGGDGYQRPRSGGYEGVSPRPRSSGYGGNAGAGRLTGSSDSMVSRPNFYDGRSSPISQDKVGYKDFGLHGRHQFDGTMSKMNEIQSVNVGYQRPGSGGYGGHSAGRSIASSDNMSRPNIFNGPRLPVSREKLDDEDFTRGTQDQYHLEDFSRGTQDQYHLEGSFSTAREVEGLDFVPNTELDNSMDPFNEFDSYRTRREIQKAEPNVDEEHQKMAQDSSMEYNMLNLESLDKGGGNEDMVVKADHRLDVEQKFFVEDKRHNYTEEGKRIESARKETVKDQLAKEISLQKRQDGGLEQDRREIAEVAINREPMLESIDPHTVVYETSGQLKEDNNPPNIDLGLQDQDKLADRFASSRITAGRIPRLVQHDSTPNMRSPNYHNGRDVGPQPNSYASRSSAMSWRRETNETKNGSPQRFSSQYGDYNYRSQSRESPSAERYQFRHG